VSDERKLISNAEIGQKCYFSGENGTRDSIFKIIAYFMGENGTNAEPQVNPPPKASSSISSPFLSVPCS